MRVIGGEAALHVTFHGVRGSTPCHGDDTRRYGGNTSCVSLRAPGEQPLLFDLGTGLRYFGACQPHDGTFRGTCLLTHLHWDHAQGLPFFTPLLKAGSELDIHAPAQSDGTSAADAFCRMIRPPAFPVSLDVLPGTIRIHDTADAEFAVGGYSVMSRLIPHIGPTLGYRVEWNGRSVAYLSDHQQPRDGSFALSDGARELVEGVDLLIHDSQFTPAEFAQKSDWGHCTIEYALWVAEECGVGTLALFHHDPGRTDTHLDGVVDLARSQVGPTGPTVIAAAEGQVVVLPVD